MSASSIPHAARTQAVGDQYKALDICVVTFNSARVVKSLIESVAGDPIVARVRVFDNASQDDSHEVARATAAELDVPVELIRSARNIGFAAASNELLRRCEAGTVALVNPDVQLRPGVTSRLVATVTTELSVGLATCRLMTAGDKAQAEAARPRPSLWRLFAGELPGGVRRLARGHPARGAGESSLYADRDVECASGALLAFRRELLHEVGYLDESVFMYLEDMDFAARVRSAGYRIRYLGTTWVWHDSGHSRRERESGLDALMPMVWLTYVRRYGGTCERLAARPVLLTVCAVAALRRLLGAETPRGELLAMWRAISFRPVREPSW